MDARSADHFLPYGRQLVDEGDIAAVAQVLRGDFLTQGPAVDAFESAFARTVDADKAVALSSGTAALHVAYLAMGVGPGDTVIVPTITFVASASAARLAGAEVVFADVDPTTGLMRTIQFNEAISHAREKVKAVCLVHLNGRCADLAEISEICRARGIKVLEDACHALGTRYEHAGTWHRIGDNCHSDATVFSMHPVKTIAMGEGGVLTTHDPEIYSSAIRLRSHGIVRDAFSDTSRAVGPSGEVNPWYYEMVELGFNYRASDIHCALGLSQLSKLDVFAQRRQDLAACYRELLAPLAPAIRPIAEIKNCQPVLHLFAVSIDFNQIGVDRGVFMRTLRDQGIGTQVHFIPVHSQPYYRNRYGALSLPGAEHYYRHALSLPLAAGMELSDCGRVVDAIRSLVRA